MNEFIFNRPFHRGDKDKSNEFKVKLKNELILLASNKKKIHIYTGILSDGFDNEEQESFYKYALTYHWEPITQNGEVPLLIHLTQFFFLSDIVDGTDSTLDEEEIPKHT